MRPYIVMRGIQEGLLQKKVCQESWVNRISLDVDDGERQATSRSYDATYFGRTHVLYNG